MTVAVSHHATSISDEVLSVAVREAAAHGTSLSVIHAVTALDLDRQEALRVGIADVVDAILDREGIPDQAWDLHVVASATERADDVAATVLEAVQQLGATMLVIGARRRSPVGKAFLGSLTQELILDAPVPVLVVKGTTS